MAQTLEQRMLELEKKVAELAAQTAAAPGRDAWRRTFGLSRDDPEFEEMIRLGQQYRQNLGNQNNGADS